mgnify:FL=1|tara:strand:- start:846 stop:2186 length:1341 start_codon:yes stop_codon:yes gene_type:complete
MPHYEYDLFIIGGGSGGIRAARISSNLGARVALAEESDLGGTCVNVGCVPKKLLFYASHFAEDFNNSNYYGWSFDNKKFNWNKLIKNKNIEIERLNNIYKKMLLDASVDIFSGHASLVDSNTIKIGDKLITSKNILISTGGYPFIPKITGNDHVFTSNEAFFLKSLPKKIIIVGGGYIAVEFASIFNELNVETHLIYRGSLFLRGFDNDLREQLKNEMIKKGINLKFNTEIEKISKKNNNLTIKLTSGESLNASHVMYATGRMPNSTNMNLDQVGVKLDKNNAIKVNKFYQTNLSSIYAIGDVCNRHNLTPVALAEGSILANNLFNKKNDTLNYNNIATCIFSQPNVATVGLSEEEAKKKYNDIKVFKSSFTPMKLTLTKSDEKNFIKLIIDKETDLVIGAHLVSDNAGEIIQGIAIAIKSGATKKIFDETIGIHPTIAEEFVSMR